MESVSLDDLEEVDLLLTGLEISQGKKNLILCSVASPAYRDRIIAAVAARFPIRVMAVERGDKLISDLRNAKVEKEEILIWTLPERLSADILEALNNFRELFYDAGVPSLVFITPAGVDEIIWKAPDFWRYRGGYHILKGEAKEVGLQALDALSIPLNFSYKNKEELLQRKRINEYLLEKMQSKKEKMNLMSELGSIHLLLSEPRKAIEFHEQALAISREIGDHRGEGVHLGNLGLAYSDLGESRKAIEFYEQALAISREIGDRRGEGNQLGNLGSVYYYLGLGMATSFSEQALNISREIGDRRSEVIALGNLGLVYYSIGNPRKAMENHEQALNISREIGDRRSEVIALGNLGLVYYYMGNPRKAMEFYWQALNISREIGDSRSEVIILGNVGLAYFYYMNSPRKAIEFYEQQLAIARNIGDRRGKGNALWNMSQTLEKLDRRAKAIECARAALKIYEEIESPDAEKVKQKLKEWGSS
jgi:tetratricopeptide (TPR) repeat protein